MIIGFSGYTKSGKDEAGRALEEELGYERRAFATGLKECLRIMDPYVGHHPAYPTAGILRLNRALDVYGEVEVKQEFPEYRRLLQVFATEVVRDKIDPDAWVKMASARMGGPGANVVFTDARFANEYACIEAFGGYVIRIERPGFGPINDHRSEQVLPVDHTIVNDGTLEEFRAAVVALVKSLVPRPLVSHRPV